MTHNLLLLPGDGIGTEIMAEVEKLIAYTNSEQLTDFATDGGLVGGCAYDACGQAISEDDMAKALSANAVLFGNSGSIILMVWGFVMLRRLPAGREWPAIVAAISGAAILLGRSLELSTANLIGDLFCLLAGILYAGYLLILHDARKQLGSWSLLALAGLASTPVLLSVALLRGEAVWPTDWTPLLVLAFSSQIVGQGLLVYAMRLFPPLVIGIGLLTQPAVAALVGWWVFDELLVPLDVLGIVLVASALVLARVVTPRVRG